MVVEASSDLAGFICSYKALSSIVISIDTMKEIFEDFNFPQGLNQFIKVDRQPLKGNVYFAEFKNVSNGIDEVFVHQIDNDVWPPDDTGLDCLVFFYKGDTLTRHKRHENNLHNLPKQN